MTQPRTPQGTPTGGRFAASTHEEPTIGLAASGSFDLTDPTRDLCNEGDLTSQSGRPEREAAKRNIVAAVRSRYTDGQNPGPVSPEVFDEIGRWDAWANRRWKATGDPYYAKFRGGLQAGLVALASDPDDSDISDALVAWRYGGVIDPNEVRDARAALSTLPISVDDVDDWRRWTSSAQSSGSQDGALLTGRVVAGVDRPEPPSTAED